MKLIYCDACHEEINEKAVCEMPLKVRLPLRGQDGKWFEFEATAKMGRWLFNSTDRHFCHACWVKALKVAVAEIPQPHNCKELNQKGGAHE